MAGYIGKFVAHVIMPGRDHENVATVFHAHMWGNPAGRPPAATPSASGLATPRPASPRALWSGALELANIGDERHPSCTWRPSTHRSSPAHLRRRQTA